MKNTKWFFAGCALFILGWAGAYFWGAQNVTIDTALIAMATAMATVWGSNLVHRPPPEIRRFSQRVSFVLAHISLGLMPFMGGSLFVDYSANPTRFMGIMIIISVVVASMLAISLLVRRFAKKKERAGV